jgi:hypothetical protein
MADEALEMGRLRSKFGVKMADSPEAATFDMLLRPGAMQTREFRQVALGLSKADALKELLSDWKGRHPDSGDAAALPTPPAAKAGGAAKAADARPGRPRG